LRVWIFSRNGVEILSATTTIFPGLFCPSSAVLDCVLQLVV